MSTRITQLAQSFGARAPGTFQDTVTFNRPVNTKDAVGGVTASYGATIPASIPCKYEAYTGKQFQVGEKVISEASYVIKVPSYYSAALVDVDARCQAVIAARSGGEPARTFNVDYVSRVEGIEILVYVSLES